MTSANRLTSTEILRHLVAFDTTSRNSNRPLIDWIAGYLNDHGIGADILPNAAGDKANLHAIIGPRIAGGLALSGHVDTVPVDGQAWSSDPFRLHEQDGRLHARGAVDMKGFVACMLAAVPELVRQDRRTPIHLFITYDEEVNCAGATALVAHLRQTGLVPSQCVIGEPSDLMPIIAHKGRLSVRATVTGRAGHSSRPAEGVNAVHEAAHAIAWIDAEQARLAREGRRVPGFEPPHTTIHAGVFHGGSALNIIPDTATFELEWRTVPGDDAEEELNRLRRHLDDTRLPAMQAVDARAGFAFEILNELPPLALDPGHDLAAAVRQAANRNHDGKVSYGTEAGIYQNAGIASIVCGPGSITRAHQPDEWIGADELAACDAFLQRLAAPASVR